MGVGLRDRLAGIDCVTILESHECLASGPDLFCLSLSLSLPLFQGKVQGYIYSNYWQKIQSRLGPSAQQVGGISEGGIRVPLLFWPWKIPSPNKPPFCCFLHSSLVEVFLFLEKCCFSLSRSADPRAVMSISDCSGPGTT